MREIHDDDEPLIGYTEGETSPDGKMEARIIHKQEAAMEESEYKVLLELKGVGSPDGRLGVDLVTVLDVSGSMRGDRLNHMKLAMQFLIQKLGPTDRLSVVTFNRKADKLCPLRQITEESRDQITDQVNQLTSRSTTNTEAGLRMAIKMLHDRNHTKSRRAAIMLVSDGVEDAESQAAGVPVSNVPVHTFGLGSDFDSGVLIHIAKNSHGGMFAAVSEFKNLTAAFSLSLAGILNVAVDELTLTIAPSNDYKITEVKAGTYQQQKGGKVDGPVMITFGSLYDRETRKVLVKLTLPEVTEQLGNDIFQISYEYRGGGKESDLMSDTESIHVTRRVMPTEAENDQEVAAEERRLETASRMKEARLSADNKELEKARKFLVDAKSQLSEADAILIAQLDHLFRLMVSQETYDKIGNAFALALEISHEAQRATTFASANAFKVRMFNTPLMDQFIEQAGYYDKEPNLYQVPTEEMDRQKVALVF